MVKGKNGMLTLSPDVSEYNFLLIKLTILAHAIALFFLSQLSFHIFPSLFLCFFNPCDAAVPHRFRIRFCRLLFIMIIHSIFIVFIRSTFPFGIVGKWFAMNETDLQSMYCLYFSYTLLLIL